MDYKGFTEEIKKMCNIDLSNYKEKQMKRRIESLIRRNGHESYDSYLELLKRSRKYTTDVTVLFCMRFGRVFMNCREI